MSLTLVLLLSVAATGFVVVLWRQCRKKHLDRWLGTYLREMPKRRLPGANEEVHLLLCVCDHYEPKWSNAPPELAARRVHRWTTDYPQLFGAVRDSDGRTPRHTFFYPIEQYEPDYLDALARLCAGGFGEVEVHLHHDADTAEALRRNLLAFKELLAERHGLLARHRHTGEVKYGFIHGNWCLDNSHPSGRWCGVNNEIDVLRETGCYADFTLPAAPSGAQTRKINSIYYAVDDPLRPKSHDWGTDVGIAPPPGGALMLIQGPLLLEWRNRKAGVLPRLENGCLQGNQPPGIDRLPLWLKARVQVPTRPDWFFVKLHAHGAEESSQEALLGDVMVQFHRDLARYAEEHQNFHYHYVTARELYNLARAAEAGWQGTVADALDYELVRNEPRSHLPGNHRPPMHWLGQCAIR